VPWTLGGAPPTGHCSWRSVQSFQIGRIACMFAWPAVFARTPGLDRCGCCGGVYRRRQVTELASTRGVFICRECAQFAAMPR
jgi:hypothetical protein